MKAYSKDLRLKVLDALDRGMDRREVGRVFGVSLPTIKRCSYIQGWAANFLGYVA
ncbi:MAG: IS630 transposase-related protein [Gemmatimonadales bacterium]